MGQRPMSQRRDTFPVIDKGADLLWLVLRPLSAKLMKETIPELNSWVDRSKLLGIWWRWRKTQIEMARSSGWEDFPTPAGWCLLTDMSYSIRLKNIIKNGEIPPKNEISLLTIWRHFSLWESRIIVWRNKEENELIEKLAWTQEYLIQVTDFGSPIATIKWEINEEAIKLASGICARYSDWKNEKEVSVSISQKSWKQELSTVAPIDIEDSKKYMIG